MCGGEHREYLLEAEKERTVAQPWRIRPSIRFSFSFHKNYPLNNDHRRAVKFAPFLNSSCYVTVALKSKCCSKPGLKKYALLSSLCLTKQGRGAGSNMDGDSSKFIQVN